MLKATGLFFIAIGFSVSLFGQHPKPDPVQLRYAGLITAESCREQLEVVASPEFAGRLPGTEGIKKASDYISGQFRQSGLRGPVNGSFFQPVDLVETKFGVKHFRINGRELVYGRDFYVTGTTAPTEINTDSLVLITPALSKQELASRLPLVKGKAVLMVESNPHPNAERNKQIQHILQNQPSVLIFQSPSSAETLKQSGPRMMRSRIQLREDATVPATGHNRQGIPVVHLATDIPGSAPSTWTHPRIACSVQASFGEETLPLASDNVLGFLEGTDKKEELLVLTAHYDHEGIDAEGNIYYGADDNGSGTVTLMQVAKAFGAAKAAGHGPRRSILFLAVTAEEKGLLGSDFYTRNPVFPLSNTVVNLNMDMIGRIDDKHLQGNHNYVHAIGADKLSPELRIINETANATYTQMELDYMYDDPNDRLRLFYRSDHYNFAKNGIPVIFYFSGLHPHYHTPEDTVDKINFDMLAKRAHLIFHTAWEIANRDQRLTLKK